MEATYKPSAPVALMKCFDSPNAHSSYYIQWSIGKSLSLKSAHYFIALKNEKFEAGQVELENSTKYLLEWGFHCYFAKETNHIYMALSRTDDEEDEDAPDVPIICRFAIMNKVTGFTKYHVSMFINSTSNKSSLVNWRIPVDEASGLDFPNGDYVYRCWLDIPTKIIDGKPPFTCDPRGNFGSSLIASSVATLFNAVVGRKTNDFSTSDIVLIPEEGEREKRRFYCHRNILSIRSPIFKKMLGENFKEAKERGVEVEDVDGDVLEIILKYIYTGECPSGIDCATIRQVIDDIPAKVIDGKPPPTCIGDPRGNCGSALASDVATLFNEVVGRKTGDSMGTSDIVLITEKGGRKERLFKCHRNILTIRSPIFKKMLSQNFNEANEREVEIEAIDGNVMEIVLKYIYTGKIVLKYTDGEYPWGIDFATIRRVIDVAEKYMLPELKDESVRQCISGKPDDAEWADYLVMSEKYNIPYLKNISMLALSSNARAMDEKEIREKLSNEAMVELADMVAKRKERSKMMEASNA